MRKLRVFKIKKRALEAIDLRSLLFKFYQIFFCEDACSVFFCFLNAVILTHHILLDIEEKVATPLDLFSRNFE